MSKKDTQPRIARITRGRKLTSAEAEAQATIRGQIADEFPEKSALSHPITRPFPRVAWTYEGQAETGELIGASPDNEIGLALTGRGFIRRLPLNQFKPR
jgi:hypothetical protein